MSLSFFYDNNYKNEFNTFYIASKKEFINLEIKSDVLQIKFDLFLLFAFFLTLITGV